MSKYKAGRLRPATCRRPFWYLELIESLHFLTEKYCMMLSHLRHWPHYGSASPMRCCARSCSCP